MADPIKGNKSAAANMGADDFATAAPEGAIVVSTGRSMYKPELCKDFPIQGYLIAAEELGENSKVGVFTGLIFRLTKKTKTPDAKGGLQVRNAGEEVILPMTFELNGLDESATNPDEVGEFWLKATDKETLPNSHTLWHYDVRFIKKVPRSTIVAKAAAIFGASPTAPQMPQTASA